MEYPNYGLPKKWGIGNKGIKFNKRWNLHIILDHPKNGVSESLHNENTDHPKNGVSNTMIVNYVDNVDKIICNNGNNLQTPSRVKHLYQNKNK